MFKLSASGLVFGSVDFIRERIRKVVKYIYQNDCNLFPGVCLFLTQRGKPKHEAFLPESFYTYST